MTNCQAQKFTQGSADLTNLYGLVSCVPAIYAKLSIWYMQNLVTLISCEGTSPAKKANRVESWAKLTAEARRRLWEQIVEAFLASQAALCGVLHTTVLGTTCRAKV